jgi:hypothetical protein
MFNKGCICWWKEFWYIGCVNIILASTIKMIKAYKNRYIVNVTLLNLNCINVQEFFSILPFIFCSEKKKNDSNIQNCKLYGSIVLQAEIVNWLCLYFSWLPKLLLDSVQKHRRIYEKWQWTDGGADILLKNQPIFHYPCVHEWHKSKFLSFTKYYYDQI